MASETLLIKHAGTGKQVEYPLLKSTLGADTVDIRNLYKDLGCFTHDPGFVATASCSSKITFIDGDSGVLLYRGYPIEQLAESCEFTEVAYLLMNGNYPTSLSVGLQSGNQRQGHHPRSLKILDGFHYDAHPMAMLVGVVGSLSAFYHSDLNIKDPVSCKVCATRLIGKMPTIAAARIGIPSAGLSSIHASS